MNRAQMVEKLTFDVLPYHERVNPPGGECLCGHVTELGRMTSEHIAHAALDAVLPQVTTVEELEALPFGTTVIDHGGGAWTRYHLSAQGVRPLRWRNPRGSYGWTSERLAGVGPLTVVWTPEAAS